MVAWTDVCVVGVWVVVKLLGLGVFVPGWGTLVAWWFGMFDCLLCLRFALVGVVVWVCWVIDCGGNWLELGLRVCCFVCLWVSWWELWVMELWG